jgi:hypothetical protein
MTPAMDRRRLLTNAVLGSAALVGASALGSFAPEAALAAEPMKIEPGAPDPNFVEGRITGIDAGLLLVTGSDSSLSFRSPPPRPSVNRVRTTTATSVWKLRPTTADQIQVGDGLYARGLRMPDGTLAADSLWVNIVSLHVTIVAIGRTALQLDHHGQRIVGHLVSGVTAAAYNGTPAISDLSMINVGKHAQVIGAWRPDTNEVDIATIYTAAA